MKDWLPLTEAAKVLGVPRTKLMAMMHNGALEVEIRSVGSRQLYHVHVPTVKETLAEIDEQRLERVTNTMMVNKKESYSEPPAGAVALGAVRRKIDLALEQFAAARELKEVWDI